MNIETAQAQTRYSFLRGGVGAIISGGIWLAAAIVADSYGINKGFITLFFGGMLIFPLSALVVKVLFKRPLLAKGHPSSQIVIETIFPMIGLLFVAWLMIPIKPQWVFAIAAIGIGTHYFGFRSAYGDITNWVLGAIVTLVGLASILFKIPEASLVPYLVAIIEVMFGTWFILQSFKKDKPW